MNNGDKSAYPMCDNVGTEKDPAYIISNGLTKREIIAMHLHAALLTATDNDGTWTGLDAGAAEYAVTEADALLKELEK